jgi:hypothetical protein
VADASTFFVDVGGFLGAGEGGEAVSKARRALAASWKPTLRTAIQRSIAPRAPHG